jgi:hypothetical protein
MNEYLLALQIALKTVDWEQTRQVAAHPATYYEMNDVLGKHPSAGNVNRYFIATEAITLGAAYSFPKYSTEILGVSTTISFLCVRRNVQIGLQARF